MLTKFSRWLANARRFCGTRKTIRRSPRNRLGWSGMLEHRISPAVFGGGVTVASADVDGDGHIDMITGAGPGGAPLVKVFSGKTGALIRSFDAFDPSVTTGIYVAAADVNGDGRADIIVGEGQGGLPRVRVFDGITGAILYDFLAYSRHFVGGVRVAAGDVTGDGKADIITAPGPGGGPQVEVFDGTTGKIVMSTLAYDANFTGGVFVGVGDITGDGRMDVITGAGAGGKPIVNVLDPTNSLHAVRSFFAYDPNFRGGVTVAGTEAVSGQPANIITGAGPGGGPHVEVFSGTTLKAVKSFFAYDPKFTGGVFVSRSDFNQAGSDEIVTGPGAGGGPNVLGFDGDTLKKEVSFYAYAANNSPVVSPGPFANVIDTTPPVITITSPSGSPTQRTNLTVTGKAVDNREGGLSKVQVSVDGGAAQNVSFDASGNFSFTSGFAIGGTADGPHSLKFTAADKSGNQAVAKIVNFTLDSSVTTPTLNLDPASDTGTIGDFITSDTTVTLDGTTDAGATLSLTLPDDTTMTTTADASGNFTFTNITLASGQNAFTVIATDSLGNTAQTTITVILNSAPTVSTPISDVFVPPNTADQTINLSNNFTDVDVVDTLVTFNTTAGAVNVELFDKTAPLTVANFLTYVDSGVYTNSIFHRLVAGFVLQGGGFDFHTNPSRLDAVPTNAPVPNEFGASNTEGTIAMAKLDGDPNSATSQWFFNLADNSSNLDNQNGGFTVFGEVTSGMDVIQKLATFAVSDEGGTFNQIPLQNYNGTNFPTDTTFANYAGLTSVVVTRRSDRLSFSVTGNDNSSLVTASIVGNTLTLHFIAGQTGNANITITATDLNGDTVSQTFKVDVNPSNPAP